jgi:general secretion pathway protein D
MTSTLIGQRFAVASAAVLLAGCATTARPLDVRAPLAIPPRLEAEAAGEASDANPAGGRQFARAETPTVQTPSRALSRMGDDPLPPGLGTQPVALNFDGIPLSAFVSEALGNLLKVPVRVAPDVQSMIEPITLRTPESRQPEQVFRLVQQVLGDYGVQVRVEDGLVQVRKMADGAESPSIISNDREGSAITGFRPVLQIYELEVVRATEALKWLQSLFGRDLTVETDEGRNALLIRGKPQAVRQAIDALKVFDTPGMRGRVSAKLEPAFIPAGELTDRLVEALVAQGYGAARTLGVPSSVLAIPIPSANTILLFASSPATLEYAVQWARELDKPNPTSAGPSLFYYQVKNTKAEELAAILGGAEGEGQTGATTAAPVTGADANPAATATATANVQGGAMLVDRPRNALIFRGDATTWQRMLPLIQQMDRAPRQVLVEVTIAEVTLSDDEQFGINWGGRDSPGRFNGRFQFGTLPNSDLNPAPGTRPTAPDTGDSPGFVYQLSVGNSVRAKLSALANANRISVLSTPRLMVKSGAEASIDVGNEVPTLTSQSVSNQQTGGNTGLIQGIQYRKTGILLSIRPTVYSEDRVDLEIRQEVSEAQPVGANAAVQSPAIFNRSLTTSLSLRDGSSHILGGLMSRRDSLGTGGIPTLQDVPVLGRLFRNQNESSDKTELVLIITPYIIDNDDDAREVTEAVRRQLEMIRLPSSDGTTDTTGGE